VAIRVALLVAACWGGAAAHAAGADCAAPKEKIDATLSEGVYEDVQAATELLAKSKVAEAIEKLTKLADKGSDYEKAIINYNLGFAYSSKNDTPGAAKAFAKALSYNALPRAQREQLQYNLGQLYIVSSQYDEGIKTTWQRRAARCRPKRTSSWRTRWPNASATRKRCRRSTWPCPRPRSPRNCGCR
jgi:tetratricopeptide (TPR) repeat protein